LNKTRFRNKNYKLNEVAHSYSDLAPKINAVEGFEFVWITDGKGWDSARNKLQEAFSIIPSIYNLSTMRIQVRSAKKAVV
jgi:type II restriction enzyme